MAFLANAQAGLGRFTQRPLTQKEEEVGPCPYDNHSCGTHAIALTRFHGHNVICPQTILRDKDNFFLRLGNGDLEALCNLPKQTPPAAELGLELRAVW